MPRRKVQAGDVGDDLRQHAVLGHCEDLSFIEASHRGSQAAGKFAVPTLQAANAPIPVPQTFRDDPSASATPLLQADVTRAHVRRGDDKQVGFRLQAEQQDVSPLAADYQLRLQCVAQAPGVCRGSPGRPVQEDDCG